MPDKIQKIFKTGSAILSICCLALIFAASAAGQLSKQEKQKGKDFGSSIRPKVKPKNEKRADKSPKNNPISIDTTEDIIKIETNLVRNEVLVIDKNGNAVLGLKKNDFVVKENSILEEIEFFAMGDNVSIPRSIILIIDHSFTQAPYIKSSVAAAKVLVVGLSLVKYFSLVRNQDYLLKSCIYYTYSFT